MRHESDPNAMEQESMIENSDPTVWRRSSRRMQCLSCLCNIFHRWHFILIIVFIIVVIGYLGRIDSSIQKIDLGNSSDFDFDEIAPTLISIDTDFTTIMISTLSAKLLFFKFTLLSLLEYADQPLLFTATYASGTYENDESVALLHYPAENTDETVFYFKITEDSKGVDLYRMQLNIRTTDADMEDSTLESTPDEWIVTMPIVYINQDRVTQGLSEIENLEAIEIIILAEALLTNGFYVTGIMEGMISDLRVQMSTIAGFPNNADLSVEYLLGDGDEGNTVPITIRFSMALLPAEPMPMRLADERIGYFTTSYSNLGDHRSINPSQRGSSLIDPTITVINRRRLLIGGDPLVYYIDPSVPSEWRDSIKKGVEAWQPAFEKIGYGSSMIIAVSPGDTDWPEDYDPSDIRFNSITWAVDMSEVFAIGPATIDPRTGEILRSNIIFTSGWIKAWLGSLEKIGGTTATNRIRRKLFDKTANFSKSSNHHDHHEHEEPDKFFRHKNGNIAAKLLPHFLNSKLGYKKSVRFHSQHSCQGIRTKHSDAFLAGLVGIRNGLEIDSELWDMLIMQGLTEVTVHEVGHTLGLRHNFEGSTESSLADLQDPTYASKIGLTASVMDYLPINIVSSKLREEAGFGDIDTDHWFYTQVIGSYDYWAIEYGYSSVDYDSQATLMLTQYAELEEIAARALAFSTDEDISSSDGIEPMVSVFDLGSDPLAYYTDRLQLISEIRPTLLDRAVEMGEQFTFYTDFEKSLMYMLEVSGSYAAKYIGGVKLSKQRREEYNTSMPLQTVDFDKQRDALGLIVAILTSSGEFGGINSTDFLPSPLNYPAMVEKGGMCTGLERYCLAVEPFDPVVYLEQTRENILSNLITQNRLDMIRLNSWGSSYSSDISNVFTVLEMFSTLTNSIYGSDLLMDSRVDNPENWSLMLFWTDVLMEMASGGRGKNGDYSAFASGEVYRIISSAPELFPNSTSWGLNKELQRRVLAWERNIS